MCGELLLCWAARRSVCYQDVYLAFPDWYNIVNNETFRSAEAHFYRPHPHPSHVESWVVPPLIPQFVTSIQMLLLRVFFYLIVTDEKPRAIKKVLVLPGLGRKIDEITHRKQSMHKLKCISLSAVHLEDATELGSRWEEARTGWNWAVPGICCVASAPSQPMLPAGFGSQYWNTQRITFLWDVPRKI